MMQVASLELCKELYELSGWEGTSQIYMRKSAQKWTINSVYLLADGDCPAYALGYLLRKLPKFISIWQHKNGWTGTWEQGNKDGDSENDGSIINAKADTPEDAAAKLAIELFKQGILKKEDHD